MPLPIVKNSTFPDVNLGLGGSGRTHHTRAIGSGRRTHRKHAFGDVGADTADS